MFYITSLFVQWSNGEGIEPPAAPAPATAVGGVGRVIRYPIIIKVGEQVYEADTADEAEQVVRKVKRIAKRKLNQFRKSGNLPALPEIEIIHGEAPPYLRERVDETNHALESLYATMRALEDDDEDILLLLH